MGSHWNQNLANDYDFPHPILDLDVYPFQTRLEWTCYCRLAAPPLSRLHCHHSGVDLMVRRGRIPHRECQSHD